MFLLLPADDLPCGLSIEKCSELFHNGRVKTGNCPTDTFYAGDDDEVEYDPNCIGFSNDAMMLVKMYDWKLSDGNRLISVHSFENYNHRLTASFYKNVVVEVSFDTFHLKSEEDYNKSGTEYKLLFERKNGRWEKMRKKVEE